MDNEKSCEKCFWSSIDGYCTEGGRAPELCKEVCDKYEPSKYTSTN